MSDNPVVDAASTLLSKTTIYQDGLQPAVKQLGKSLETVTKGINVILAPLSAMVFAYDKVSDQLKSRLSEKLAKINIDDLVTPPLNLFGPLVEKYRYSFNEGDLADMFENLLANSMDKNTASKVHPSFVNAISELTPDEAKLIKFLSNSKVLPKIDISYHLPSMVEGGYLDQYVNFTNFGKIAGLQFSNLVTRYLDNLERMGIIDISKGSFAQSYTDKNIYKPLREHPLIKSFEAQINQAGGNIEISEGIIRITDYGRMFFEAVLSKK